MNNVVGSELGRLPEGVRSRIVEGVNRLPVKRGLHCSAASMIEPDWLGTAPVIQPTDDRARITSKPDRSNN
jgi:hypothetical protein